jgi:hypothetical protein
LKILSYFNLFSFKFLKKKKKVEPGTTACAHLISPPTLQTFAIREVLKRKHMMPCINVMIDEKVKNDDDMIDVMMMI